MLRNFDESYLFFIGVLVFLGIIELCFRLGRTQRLSLIHI